MADGLCECHCPRLDGRRGGDDPSGGSGRLSPPPLLQGAAVCGECGTHLAAGAAALLQGEGVASLARRRRDSACPAPSTAWRPSRGCGGQR